VYWDRADLRLAEVSALGAEGVLASPEFVRARTVPDECRGCEFVASCHGGCAGRRALAGDVRRADAYCPLIRGQRVHLEWAPAEHRELLKTGSACTTVVAPA
jgi:sulfatase maturation enzyme AslB (radical SAM superfamily)